MECLMENQCCEKGIIGDRIGMKRLSVEVEGNLEAKRIRLGEGDGNFAGEDRFLEGVDLNAEGLGEARVIEEFNRSSGDAGELAVIVIDEEEIENGAVVVGESRVRDEGDGVFGGKEVACSSVQQLSDNVGVVDERQEIGFDLNVPVWEAKKDPAVSGKKVEIVDISSDDSDDDDVIIVGAEKGKLKQVEGINTFGSSANAMVGSGDLDLDLVFADNSVFSGVQRYSREEKGKAKISDSWLSLYNTSIQMEIPGEGHEYGIQQDAAATALFQVGPIEEGLFDDQFMNWDLGLLLEQSEAYPTLEMPVEYNPMPIAEPFNQVPVVNLEFRREQAAFDDAAANELQRRADVRHRELLLYSAPRFARFNSQEEGGSEGSGQKQKQPSDIDEQLGNTPGPFSDALTMIRKRCLKRNAQQLIVWKGPKNTGNSDSAPPAPSLLDLSLKLLVQNADALVSLEGVPDTLRKRITDLLCNSRRMNTRFLNLLLQGSPTEIRIKDCSWLTEVDFTKSFKDFDGRNLMVLQLDLCGQCLLDHVLGITLARSSQSLPKLGILSLRGACRISDNALRTLVKSTPILQSIDLRQCSLLTHDCVDIISKSLGSSLKELRIDECQRIEASHIVSALKNLKHLEVLSVAGIPTVCDHFVCEMIPACGQTLKELDLADCEKLTDCSLKAIGDACPDLRSLNLSKLYRLTDVGIQFLANGCRSIQRLNLRSIVFSDEAIAAYLEASGQSLEELSLNNCSKVGPNTAFSLAKCSRKLQSLDLSWCRKVTDDSLGLIVDSCVSLKLVKLFGCTQITDIFVNGHSNSQVKIVGLQMTHILDSINKFEPEEVLLRYSSLKTTADSLKLSD